MSVVSAARLLETWEEAVGQHPIQRALTLLRLEDGDNSVEALALLAVGERDRRLIALRERLIGPRFEAVATCPACGARVEMSFTTDQMASSSTAVMNEPIEVVAGEFRIVVRTPTTVDLAAAAAAIDPPAARRVLLSRCVLLISRGGESGTVDQLPASAVNAIQERLADVDPFGGMQVDVVCPTCAHVWQAALDPAGYLWREIDERAQRLMREVHALARGYGWREQDILLMSDRRRRGYLALLGEE